MKALLLLARRIPRDIIHDFGKYLGIFVLLALTISFCTGYFVAAANITEIVDTAHDTYTVEDAEFTVSFPLSDEALDAIDEVDKGISLYKKFSFDAEVALAEGENSTDVSLGTLRVFANRTEVNLAAYFEGGAPAAPDEIAIDRLFAANNNIALGDTLNFANNTYTVVGIAALSDYAALMESNTDLIMNCLTFGVGLLTQDAFDALEENDDLTETYTYALRFADRSLTQAQRTDIESDIATALSEAHAELTDLLDWEANKAITYAAEDLEADQGIWSMLLYVLIAILAFVFVILTSATIEGESPVIGTLLASGYSAAELVAHYATAPLAVGLVACAVGNIAGYIFFVDLMAGLYYNSYSLPPLTITFNAQALINTTLIPYLILAVVSTFGIARRMRTRPLQFLRRELSRTKRRMSGVVLPQGWSYKLRFRARICLSNLGNFCVLFCGVFFAVFLMLFVLSILPSVENYTETAKTDLVAEHLYSLKGPLEIDATEEEREIQAAAEKLAKLNDDELTELVESDPTAFFELVDLANQYDADANPVNTKTNSEAAIEQAEKIAVYSLEAPRVAVDSNETVRVYGIQENSRYWTDVNVADGAVVVGTGLADKCGAQPGEVYTFYDKLEDKSIALTIAGVTGSISDTNVYMSLEMFCDIFDHDADYFNGYASNDTLAFDARYLVLDFTEAELQKVTDQFYASMGDMLNYLVALGILIFFVLMYLLTKTIVDKSAQIISRFKVFGYTDGEVNGLYLASLSFMALVSLAATVPLSMLILARLFTMIMAEYSGNFLFSTTASAITEVLLMGGVAYLAVALLQMWRIRRVPLSLALKVTE